jgi:hypothetical protein
MAWIIGKKSDESVLQFSIKTPDFTLNELQQIIPNNYGGTSSDYSYLQITELEANRYSNGDVYNIIWTDNEITGIDFTPEDSKHWAKLFTSQPAIKDDGIDYAEIKLEVWKPDLSEIATYITMLDRRVPVITPKGLSYVRLDIVNGIARANFRSTESGTYIFPSEPKRYLSLRIYNQVTVEVDLVTLFEML